MVVATAVVAIPADLHIVAVVQVQVDLHGEVDLPEVAVAEAAGDFGIKIEYWLP